MKTWIGMSSLSEFRSKIKTCLISLKRLKNILPQSQLCSVYFDLVESHLQYGDAVWGS